MPLARTTATRAGRRGNFGKMRAFDTASSVWPAAHSASRARTLFATRPGSEIDGAHSHAELDRRVGRCTGCARLQVSSKSAPALRPKSRGARAQPLASPASSLMRTRAARQAAGCDEQIVDRCARDARAARDDRRPDRVGAGPEARGMPESAVLVLPRVSCEFGRLAHVLERPVTLQVELLRAAVIDELDGRAAGDEIGRSPSSGRCVAESAIRWIGWSTRRSRRSSSAPCARRASCRRRRCPSSRMGGRVDRPSGSPGGRAR